MVSILVHREPYQTVTKYGFSSTTLQKLQLFYCQNPKHKNIASIGSSYIFFIRHLKETQEKPFYKRIAKSLRLLQRSQRSTGVRVRAVFKGDSVLTKDASIMIASQLLNRNMNDGLSSFYSIIYLNKELPLQTK